jgi:polyisoprenoid-binding protein YceI
MKTALSFLLLSLSAICGAQTKTWQIDPNHTAAQFAVRHLGISTVRGVFEKTTGTVTYDPADPAQTSIDATIDASSLNTRVKMRDDDLRSPHFFDVAKYPTIAFKSTHAEAAGAGKLKITGDLTIHGVTKQVVLDVDGPTEAIHDPMGKVRIGASATTKINRNDFGVSAMPGGIGDEIQIQIDTELTPSAAK